MILLHRLTPAAIVLALAAAFALLIGRTVPMALPLALLFAIVPLLLARLLLFEFRRPAFWVFLGLPMFLLASALLLTLFLESVPAMWALAGVVTLATGLYAENLFTFYHLPSAYQAYALEYLSLVLAVMSAFFFAAGGYGAFIFIPEFGPIWLTGLIAFFAILFLTIAVFWVSKVGFETGRRYALSAAVLLTELYVVLAFLPTSFLTNAAVFTLFFYCYLGLMRAHVLEKLSATVIRRYAAMSGVLLALILGTATWL